MELSYLAKTTKRSPRPSASTARTSEATFKQHRAQTGGGRRKYLTPSSRSVNRRPQKNSETRRRRRRRRSPHGTARCAKSPAPNTLRGVALLKESAREGKMPEEKKNEKKAGQKKKNAQANEATQALPATETPPTSIWVVLETLIVGSVKISVSKAK